MAVFLKRPLSADELEKAVVFRPGGSQLDENYLAAFVVVPVLVAAGWLSYPFSLGAERRTDETDWLIPLSL